MVRVVHDALEKSVINRFCQFCEIMCFYYLGNIGHYGCHIVRVPASVGDQLRRQTPPRTYCIQEFAND